MDWKLLCTGVFTQRECAQVWGCVFVIISLLWYRHESIRRHLWCQIWSDDGDVYPALLQFRQLLLVIHHEIKYFFWMCVWQWLGPKSFYTFKLWYKLIMLTVFRWASVWRSDNDSWTCLECVFVCVWGLRRGFKGWLWAKAKTNVGVGQSQSHC